MLYQRLTLIRSGAPIDVFLTYILLFCFRLFRRCTLIKPINGQFFKQYFTLQIIVNAGDAVEWHPRDVGSAAASARARAHHAGVRGATAARAHARRCKYIIYILISLIFFFSLIKLLYYMTTLSIQSKNELKHIERVTFVIHTQLKELLF